MPAAFRPLLAALGASIFLALIGAAWEGMRFGTSQEAAVARLEADVRGRVATRVARVERLAQQVAADAALIVESSASRDRLPTLFARLAALSAQADGPLVAATVYVPSGAAGTYRVLAWSDGPAQDIAEDRFQTLPSLFVGPGTAGLRLVFIQPVEIGGRRIGVVATETVLSDRTTPTPAPAYLLQSAYGLVGVDRQFSGPGAPSRPGALTVALDRGTVPVDLEVTYRPEDLATARALFRRRAAAVALTPLAFGLLLLASPWNDRRARAEWATWTRLTAGLAGALLASSALLTAAGWLGSAPPLYHDLVRALTWLGLSALIPAALWWRRWPRRDAAAARSRFAVEQLAGGLVVAACIGTLAQAMASSPEPARLPVFPLQAVGLLEHVAVLVRQVALGWTAASLLGTLAARWQLSPRRLGPLATGVLLWCAPTLLLTAPLPGSPQLDVAPTLVCLLVAAGFGAVSLEIRRYARHTTQAVRLLLAYTALVVPPLAVYPMAAASSETAARTLVEREYAPATVRHPMDLQVQLDVVRSEIDRIPTLAQDLRPDQPLDRRVAFTVWRQTSLAQSRVTSNIELYGPDRTLVSHFALKLPEFVYRASTRNWQGTSCGWEVFGEVARVGAENRPMLHAERGVCDADGQVLGGIVVHVAQNDYQALPFVDVADPYDEVLDRGGPRDGSRITDLQVVVYGWSLRPLYRSGRTTWPISEATFARLYQSRAAFWTTAVADARSYNVYFTQDRAQIYAVGYPAPTVLDHATNVAERMAVAAGLFILLQAGALALSALLRRPHAPLRVLFHEIRTSFYRKLFLFFVLAAIGPVLLFALAFGTYMTTKFYADVESEARAAVSIAKRVFEELAAAEAQPGQSALVPTDDVMIWIRHVIDQDVNVFEGDTLVATSQPDLLEAGLLPARTPAGTYRDIRLNRLPTSVVPDRLGSLRYVLAAAPVRAADGHEAILTLPLASRQREIAREIDDLNRRVLVGAVLVVLFAAGLGASIAGRIADPVARLTRATRIIASGRLDVRIAADTADELGKLVEDFNSMAETLLAQRGELARTNQLKAWNEMARQVAHEIKNPLTPVQLAAEHLLRVHQDRGQPLGDVVDQCVRTILSQVRILRQIASEFANFAGTPTPRPEPVFLGGLVDAVVRPYILGLAGRVRFVQDVPDTLPAVHADRTLLARAVTNLVENAVQAMPDGGTLTLRAEADGPAFVRLTVADTGIGMDDMAQARAFEPYFSTKTSGSGLGLANARRNIEISSGTIALTSRPGAGTEVVVRLPTRPAVQSSAAPETS